MSIILGVFLFQSCDKKKEAQETIIMGHMERCLSTKEAKEVVKAVEIFEKKLLEYYKLDEEKTSLAYKKYVEDVAYGGLEAEFYLSTKSSKDLEFIKSTGLLSMIYKSEEFPGATLYFLDNSGIFYKCLMKNSLIRPNEKAFLKNHGLDADISAREIAANIIMSFLKDSYDISINRVIIAFTLYYPSLLSLNSE